MIIIPMYYCCSVTKSCPTVCNPHGLQHTRLPYPSLSPGVCSTSCPLSQWCCLAISSSFAHFFCLRSFPASVFSNVLALCLGGQSTEASASESVLPINIQGWFPLGWTGLISLLSNGLSRVFSSTTIQRRQFFGTHLPYGQTLTSVHDYWINHSFDNMVLCQQMDVSAF